MIVHKNKEPALMVNLAADSLYELPVLELEEEDFADADRLKANYLRVFDRYANTQVTDLVFNINYQRTCYPSKVWDSYWNVKNKEAISAWPRYAWLAHRAGVDPFQLGIDYCRKMIQDVPAFPKRISEYKGKEAWTLTEVTRRICQFEIPMEGIKEGWNELSIECHGPPIVWVELCLE